MTSSDSDRTLWADGLEPAAVWQEFATLATIPRPSKHEHVVRDHILRRFNDLGIVARVDTAGNVVADVGAGPASEDASTVVLQAHLDMVCEADGSAATDPAVNGVFPTVVDGWVRAPGTTLGADNGIGVAVALAVAAEAVAATSREDLRWPPLQILLTVDEEQDFGGAAGVDPQLVTGRVLINLDSEDEHEVIIGSAGGSRVFVRVPTEPVPAAVDHDLAELRVRGPAGGHSGQQIDDNLMNALKALAYGLALTMDTLGDDVEAQLHVADLAGGHADNAIPREATAVVLVGTNGRAALERAARTVQERVRTWRAGADDAAVIEVIPSGRPRPTTVWSGAAARRIIDLLIALPSGVLAMDERLPGAVRTSTNLGVASTEGDELVIVSAPRSSRQEDLDALHARYASYARLVGGALLVTSSYPAWQVDFKNPLLGAVRAAYRDVYGSEPDVTTVHAGLEAGEIAAHLPGLVAVSVGPTVRDAHGPDERLDVESVARFHALVRAILAQLASPPPAV